MNSSTGLFLVLAIFVIGVAALAILFLGKHTDKAKKFSRFADKGKDKGAGEKLAALVFGLFGLGLVFLSLTGLVWLQPTIEIGAFMAWLGFGHLLPGKGGGAPGPRAFLVRAWIKLVLALGCFGGAIAFYSQIKDGYGWLVLSIPLFFVFILGCMASGGALSDYLRYVADKPLPNIEPDPAVLAELLKPPGPLAAAKPRVLAPAVMLEAKAPPASALPGLLAGAVCISAGMWFRVTELVATEVGYIVGVPLFVYGIIRCGLSLLALARAAARR